MILRNGRILFLLLSWLFVLSIAIGDRNLFNETTEDTTIGLEVDTDPCRKYDSNPDKCKEYVDPETGETCQSCQEWLYGGTVYKGTVCFNEDRPIHELIYLGCY